MFNSSNFRAAEVQFDTEGKIVDSDRAVLNLSNEQNVTDLVVMSHGWNNDMADAGRLYAKVAAAMRAVVNQRPIPAGREIALAALYWPSKKFAEEDLIPGGAAAAASLISEEDVAAAIDDLRDVFTAAHQKAALDNARGLVPQLEDKATARKQFATQLLSLLDPAAAEAEDATNELFRIAPGTLMDRLAKPALIAPPQPRQSGGALDLGDDAESPAAAGGAAGLGSTLGGILGGAKNLLNAVTYYQMKSRAGTVGEKGLAPLVGRIRSQRDGPRIHLVGHSFGGRVVSAAANALPTNSLNSLTLLQAAFSHYGFADAWKPGQPGGFRAAVANKTVSGPVLITHTGNDKAVGIAYALASRIAGQNASSVGDANDTFGGIGRNGAQKTPEAVSARLLDVGGSYTFQAGRLHNLLADQFIKDHSDVSGKEVAHALLAAVGGT
jgi:hypothetical protein